MTATITVHGGLTAAPELRYSQNGVPILSGTIASTDRYLDRQSNEWKDGKSLFLPFSAFKDLAENVAASGLDKGTQVAITGKLVTRRFEDREGKQRSVVELEVIDFMVSLKRATATVVRAQSGGQRGQAAAASAPAQDEPWTTPGSQQGWNATQPGQGDAWSTPGSFGDDTPF